MIRITATGTAEGPLPRLCRSQTQGLQRAGGSPLTIVPLSTMPLSTM